MPKPTGTAIKKHPLAVVVLTYGEKDDNNPALYDFEWFDTIEGLTDYTTVVAEWAAEDVVLTEAVLRHVVVQVTDTSTSPLTLGTISAFGGEQDWQDSVIAAIATSPDSILVKRANRSPGDAVKKTTKKAAQVAKGRQPSEAAKVAAAKADAAKKADPHPKAEQVRKAAKPKVAAEAAPKKAAPPPKAGGAKPVDREALKKRLAEKAAKQRVDDPLDSAVAGALGADSLLGFANA